MTIRRDLVKLENSNMIERCHGGAVAKQEVAYERKADQQQKKQSSNCRKMCGIRTSGRFGITASAGTTTCEIAKRICDIPDIIVVTNDLEIAQVLKN